MGDKPTPSTQTQRTSSSSTSGPSPEIAGDLQGLLARMRGEIAKNPDAPGFYPGSLVAPETARTSSAETTMWQRGAGGLGYGIDPAAKTELAKSIGGGYLDVGSNPYLQAALAAGFRPQIEQLNNITLPTLDAKFGGSGRTASGLHYANTDQLVTDVARTQSDAAAKAMAGAYDAERARQMAAIGMLPSIQGMDLQNVGLMQQAAQAGQARAQSLTDADIARYNYNSTATLDWLNNLAQRYIGMYPGGQTTGNGTTTSTGTPSSNPLANGLGAAGMGLQMLPSIFKLGGLF